MTQRITPIERAFALAASGRVEKLRDIRHFLKAEGYAEEGQLFGNEVKKQLQRLIIEARGKKAE